MNDGFDRVRTEEPPDLWPEIERRLSGPTPPRRTWVHRGSSILAAVLVASVFGAAVFALRGLHGPTGSGGPQQPAPVTRVQVPAPQPIVAGEAGVWTTNVSSGTGGGLYQIDPSTNTATLVPGTQGAWWPASGEGFAWVTTCHDSGKTSCATTDLLRIDPSSNTVTGTLPLPGNAWAITAGAGAIWVSSVDGLLKIDPQTMRIVATFPVHSNLLGVAGDYVWATEHEGYGGAGVIKIDPTTGRVVATIPFADACLFSASDQEVLVGSCRNGLPPGSPVDHVVGIDPASATVRFDVRSTSPSGAVFAAGHPWIARWMSDQRSVELVQLDPGTGGATGTTLLVPRGSHPWFERGPAGLPVLFMAVADNSLWLTHIDATDVVRVRVGGESGSTTR